MPLAGPIGGLSTGIDVAFTSGKRVPHERQRRCLPIAIIWRRQPRSTASASNGRGGTMILRRQPLHIIDSASRSRSTSSTVSHLATRIRSNSTTSNGTNRQHRARGRTSTRRVALAPAPRLLALPIGIVAFGRPQRRRGWVQCWGRVG